MTVFSHPAVHDHPPVSLLPLYLYTFNMSTWIWFPADFEIWLGNRFNNRRTERGAMFPPFWKQDSHWATVEFSREYELDEPELIHIWVEGEYSFMFDGKLQFGQPSEWLVPAGKHKINIKVHNQTTPPALFIEGKTIQSDTTWRVTHEDKIWIDENGVAHGSGIYLVPSFWNFDTPEQRPSLFQLAREEWKAQSVKVIGPKSRLIDFGRETMGYVLLRGIHGRGEISIYYGESEAEALDRDYCETLDRLMLDELTTDDGSFVLTESKAFRYVLIDVSTGLYIDEVAMQYEYLPQDISRSGSFRCSDDELNRIWQVGAYTMDLTTREFMMDGIKRDRWTWSGDAIQSYLMNYYLRFDSDTVKRTIRQLRGKDPVSSHINTILDYTFYWFKSVYDYYLYTGDRDFVSEMYPRMLTLMDYCLGRLADGIWAIGQPDDWIFIDWVDFPMAKRGIVCFEQMLFCKSLETMQICSELVEPLSELHLSNLHLSYPDVNYGELAAKLRTLIDETFWDAKRHAYLHALEEVPMSTSSHELFPILSSLVAKNESVTKFPNMFAILYNYADEKRQREILEHVLQNPEVPAITTPYMRFYELAALCQMGQQADVLPEIKAYWGGMLREGATSFWEKYNPEQSDGLVPLPEGASPRVPHLTMYGRPYGKSLCHAWGASPVYLLGRYYLGIEPTAPGYQQWQMRPALAGLEWMEGSVPTPFGPIKVRMDQHLITITTPAGIGPGKLFVAGQRYTLQPGKSTQFSY